MKEEKVKDFAGRIIGIIKTDQNGNRTAYNYPGMQKLGTYDAKTKCTKDFFGRIVSKDADTVIEFIYKELNNGR